MRTDQHARMIHHDNQVGVFIPLGQRVKITVKLHKPIIPAVGEEIKSDGYVTSEVIVNAASYAQTPRPIKIQGSETTDSILYLGMESHGPWQVDLR